MENTLPEDKEQFRERLRNMCPPLAESFGYTKGEGALAFKTAWFLCVDNVVNSLDGWESTVREEERNKAMYMARHYYLDGLVGESPRTVLGENQYLGFLQNIELFDSQKEDSLSRK